MNSSKRVFAVLTLAGAMLTCAGAHAQPPAKPSPEELQEKAKKVLAQTDGELKLPGLKEPVEVLRDRWGIAHIYAKNTHDLFFAQGFVAAQDRLFQIELWRRQAAGEMSEVFGAQFVDADEFARLARPDRLEGRGERRPRDRAAGQPLQGLLAGGAGLDVGLDGLALGAAQSVRQ